jgi:hypothetical protein
MVQMCQQNQQAVRQARLPVRHGLFRLRFPGETFLRPHRLGSPLFFRPKRQPEVSSVVRLLKLRKPALLPRDSTARISAANQTYRPRPNVCRPKLPTRYTRETTVS